MVVRVGYSPSLFLHYELIKRHKECYLLTNSPEYQIAVVMP